MQTRFIRSIRDISADQWNHLSGTDYPFLRYEFLAALEESGSTTANTGWQPHHLLLEQQGELIGLMPLFIKSHSYGEYVFDWAWADAYHRHGLEYYPKLLNAIPFTPASGPRWAIAQGQDEQQGLNQMLEAVCAEAKRLEVSSCHWLFPPQDKATYGHKADLLLRTGCQYHWFNDNYQNFDDFLAQFSSRKRKNLKKERKQVQAQNLTLHVKTGGEISADDWHEFYVCYHLTYFKRSGRQGYLSESFFPLIAKSMPENIMMVQAVSENQAVAAALYFYDSDTLYGRYWGCREDFSHLHFEACYYQGIEFAIAKGLKKFDPGAQGEHKIQRGFRPTATYSWHWLAHSEFHQAIEKFINAETKDMQEYMAAAAERLPFKQNETTHC